jgi:alpha-galactosidase
VGFVLDCGEGTTPADLLDGVVRLQAVDADGHTLTIPVWEPTGEAMRNEQILNSLRSAEGPLALKMMEALSSHPLFAGEAATAMRQGLALASAPRVARDPARSGRKIVLIGAGSTVFAKNLIGDILLNPALSASRIWLYDIDPERLRESEVVAGRIRQTLGSSATIEATLDLGKALDGAHYAITMIQVGGYRPGTVTDFEVPKQFGLRQTIGDTLGIGGIMRALRTIPVLLTMAREMERRCPNVVHLNYANPMAMNCWALSRASRIRTVGLCHSVPHTAAEMAQDIGVPPERVSYLVAGINHMAFYLKYEMDGVDLYPRLHEVIAEGRVPAWNRVRYDMLKRLGYFVTESSEHFAEYVPWYIKRDRADLVDSFNIPLDEYPRRCEAQAADWKELSKALTNPRTPLEVNPSPEYGSRIINSIETGEPVVVYGNVANAGLITNLPDGCCVEVPCLVDHNGVQPVKIGALPPQLAALMQTNINVQALTVEAALTGRREHVYHAAMLDPHTAAELDLDQIWSLVDALIEAHGGWLPKGIRR